MIIGECPYCEIPQINPCPDNTPVLGKVICEDCNEQYWLRYSRFDPVAYTRENFNKEFIVDEKTKSVTERNPAPPLTEEEKIIADIVQKRVNRDFENLMLYGTSDEDEIQNGIKEGRFVPPPEVTPKQKSFFNKIFPNIV